MRILKLHDEEGSAPCDRDTDGKAGAGQHEYFPHDEPEDAVTARSERHANADFIRPARDGVGHEAVDANANEEDGEQSKEGGKLRNKTLAAEGLVHFVRQRRYVSDRQVGIDLSDGLADFRNDLLLVAGITHLKIRQKLQMLRPGKVDSRLRPLLQGHVFGVLNHTDDFVITAVRRVVTHAESAADRRHAWEKLARHGFVDDGHFRGLLLVLRGEGASGEHRQTESGEELVSNDVVQSLVAVLGSARDSLESNVV